jgi:hypothetical protein
MGGSLLANWVFAYDVPLTVQIVFRSGSKLVVYCGGIFCLCRSFRSCRLDAVRIHLLQENIQRDADSKPYDCQPLSSLD